MSCNCMTRTSQQECRGILEAKRWSVYPVIQEQQIDDSHIGFKDIKFRRYELHRSLSDQKGQTGNFQTG